MADQMPPPDHESASLMGNEPPTPEPQGEPAMVTDSVSIRKAENGGFIVTCSKKPAPEATGGNGAAPSPGYQSKDYAFSSIGEVVSYLGQEFGQPAAAPAPAMPAAAPVADTEGDEQPGAADEAENLA